MADDDYSIEEAKQLCEKDIFCAMFYKSGKDSKYHQCNYLATRKTSKVGATLHSKSGKKKDVFSIFWKEFVSLF